MSSDPDNLVPEQLRRVLNGQEDLKRGQRELRAEIIALRQSLNALQGDGLRREEVMAGLQLDMDRIKARLELTDA